MPEGDIIKLIKKSNFKKIQLLIHPIWWNKKYNLPKEDYLKFIDKKNIELKSEISDNSNIYNF